LRLNLGTNYDLRAKENPIAPLTLGAELPSIRRFQTRFNSSYDLYNRKFTSYSLNTQLDLGDLFGLTFGGAGYTLQIEHFYSQGANELSSNLHFKPTHSWDVTARAHVDLESQKLVDYSLDLTRDLHCWEFLFSMSRLGDHLIYDFKLRIKALPDVAIGKGLFGFLLPE
jgi:lipopolysaccharide assembly outer membrane protein LptD (OstA)